MERRMQGSRTDIDLEWLLELEEDGALCHRAAGRATT